MALEHAQQGITCNALCPGWVLTPLVQAQIERLAHSKQLSLEEAQAHLLAEKEPSRRFTTPEDIGEMVAFLASPAGRNVTGSTLALDGGWTAL